MQAFIGAKLLSSNVAQPSTKPFEIYDSRLRGFTLRVQPTGMRSYYARLGRNHRIALGKVGVLRPEEAREKCPIILGNVANGRRPLHGLLGLDPLPARASTVVRLPISSVRTSRYVRCRD
jgi:hypothetical protein